MNDTTALDTSTLSWRLKSETATRHEQMQVLMNDIEPFADRRNYARFVIAQYLFQCDVEHLFANPAMQTVVPDLAQRGRAAAALADLADLNTSAPPAEIASNDVGMPEALGWLYVSEGSTLGAAFLFKEAQARLGLSGEFGARNLAAYPAGRAIAWRQFVASLDSRALTQTEHERIVAGANAAYDRFGELLHTHARAG